jgi:hypothetical protein
VILGIIEWYRGPTPKLPVPGETEAQATAAATPAGVAI